VDVFWDPSPSPNVVGYNVSRREKSEVSWTPLHPGGVVPGTRYRDISVEANKTYYYRVQAVRSPQ
jgi:hypothetical protein